MLPLPEIKIPIIPIPLENSSVSLYIKREDEVHKAISGNKYWKLFYNVNQYLELNPTEPMLISFGGAYSNHIAALAALGKDLGIQTLGIIRGEELEERWAENPTLRLAAECGMQFCFVSRALYRDKESLAESFKNQYPNALIIPEGGTNLQAVEGVKYMLNADTQDFDYICTAVGTGGTVAGLSKFAECHQQVLGFKVVKDASLSEVVSRLSRRENITLFEASYGGYGKVSDEVIGFINAFQRRYQILLDPIYTGKMMMKLLELIEAGYFPKGSNILAFHTGGLQGILGANQMLKQQNRPCIDIIRC